MSKHFRSIFGVMALLLLSACATRLDVQGHRGARGLAPENTLAAFSQALALGVTTLELDVGVTRDGVVVIYHDRTLNPDITRDASGAFLPARGAAISSLTFAELQQFDIGRVNLASTYGKPFSSQKPADGQRISRLEDLFALVKNTCGADCVRFNIETKLSPLAPTETLAPEPFAAAVLAVIDKAGMTRQVTLQSFDWRTLQIFQKSAPQVATVYLTNQQGANDTVQRGKPGASPFLAGFDVDDFAGSIPKLIKAAGGAVWSPNFRDLNQTDLKEAQLLGLKVIPWTVNDEVEMRKLIAWGVDGLISDYPDVLLRVAKGRLQ